MEDEILLQVSRNKFKHYKSFHKDFVEDFNYVCGQRAAEIHGQRLLCPGSEIGFWIGRKGSRIKLISKCAGQRIEVVPCFVETISETNCRYPLLHKDCQKNKGIRIDTTVPFLTYYLFEKREDFLLVQREKKIRDLKIDETKFSEDEISEIIKMNLGLSYTSHYEFDEYDYDFHKIYTINTHIDEGVFWIDEEIDKSLFERYLKSRFNLKRVIFVNYPLRRRDICEDYYEDMKSSVIMIYDIPENKSYETAVEVRNIIIGDD